MRARKQPKPVHSAKARPICFIYKMFSVHIFATKNQAASHI